jgi:4-hydroxy-2-oxoheptanedioate aldolase
MQGENIRQSLHSGQPVYGTHFCGLSSSIAVQIMASAPLDFVFMCAEHIPLDRSELATLFQLFAGRGISPAVRIPNACEHHAAMALDAGAQGIVAPYVETVEDVRKVASVVRYRPIKGRMLEQIVTGTRKPAPKTKEFLDRFNRHNYTIIGIESAPAYENLDALINEPGVDGVFIGLHDMSVSLEIPEEWENPKCWEVVEDIVVRCRAAGVGVGLHVHPLLHDFERVQKLVELGMNWILDGADVTQAVKGLTDRRTLLLGAPADRPADESVVEVSSCIST